MKSRTEEEKLMMSPIKVRFGAKEFEIKPLTFLPAAEWRKLLYVELSSMGTGFDPEKGADAMLDQLVGALICIPEKVIALVFAYAPYLPKEEILEITTEEQIAAAFAGVMSIAFPFESAMRMAMAIMRSSTLQQGSFLN